MFIAPEGLSNIIPVAGLSIIFWALYRRYRKITIIPGVIFTILSLFALFFFRDPAREITPGANVILAPADGVVLPFDYYQYADGTKTPMLSIFLSPLNVHINRSAVTGKVLAVEKRTGLYLPAYKPDAAEKNEMNMIIVQTDYGIVVMRQVVGFIARRLVCNLQPGQMVTAGQRIGLMKFGSRMDLILPSNIEIKVKPGEKVRAGQSIIGVWIEN